MAVDDVSIIKPIKAFEFEMKIICGESGNGGERARADGGNVPVGREMFAGRGKAGEQEETRKKRLKLIFV